MGTGDGEDDFLLEDLDPIHGKSVVANEQHAIAGRGFAHANDAINECVAQLLIHVLPRWI
jgi:hypothetical protein